jgi:cob(I)alamin adenosyltransferase
MKIYTKTGDKGMTSLIGGKRVPKNSARLESYGTIDELNSFLGMIRSFPLEQVIAEELVEIQSRLFDVGGNLATDPESSANLKEPIGVTEEDIALLENGIDRMDAEVPPCCRVVISVFRFVTWRGRSAGVQNGGYWIWPQRLR